MVLGLGFRFLYKQVRLFPDNCQKEKQAKPDGIKALGY